MSDYDGAATPPYTRTFARPEASHGPHLSSQTPLSQSRAGSALKRIPALR